MTKETERLMRFARGYAGMGDAVAEQLEDIMNGNYDDVNANALSVIEEFVGGIDEDVDVEIAEAKRAIGGRI